MAILLWSPTAAQAQYIDCSEGCTTVQYGLGNDPKNGPYLNTVGLGHPGPDVQTCGQRDWFRFQGNVKITDQDNCVVSSTNRCLVEIPKSLVDDSGFFNINKGTFDLGPLGILQGLGALFSDVSGNIGHREIDGLCTLDAMEACALDSDCPSGDGCRSTCFSNPETLCAGHGDCPNADCITKIEFDGIGTCTDDETVCTSDADCAEGDFCEDGFEFVQSLNSCVCCQSTTATICGALVGWVEYPALECPFPREFINVTGASDLVFEGGRGTKFAHNYVVPPGQQEGLCAGTVSDGSLELGGPDNGNDGGRACGARGDFWAGAFNGKCTSGTDACAGDPFNPDDPALRSPCDDVEFGGIEGDFCDFSERGFRAGGQYNNTNPDGSPDPSVCQGTIQYFVGTPNELCTIPKRITDGDPQPGCQLVNFGIVAQPDLNCNGIDDTEEGRCMPVDGVTCSDVSLCPPCEEDTDCASGVCVNTGDLCPWIGEDFYFRDNNNDGIGDECQCGDQTGDGNVTALDIGGVAQCANGQLGFLECDATIVDTNADNATTALDIAGVAQVANGVLGTGDITCVRNIDVSGM